MGEGEGEGAAAAGAEPERVRRLVPWFEAGRFWVRLVGLLLAGLSGFCTLLSAVFGSGWQVVGGSIGLGFFLASLVALERLEAWYEAAPEKEAMDLVLSLFGQVYRRSFFDYDAVSEVKLERIGTADARAGSGHGWRVVVILKDHSVVPLGAPWPDADQADGDAMRVAGQMGARWAPHD